ncbi:uncharacterized protein LOC127257125 isoform X2 [Andrographis paniculata]|uniref:uncharacterized protein LOC127257125 isoform X2 n=1 Tax=Andrographis paniculata TaxID=175694 RepID=UPI0021E95119|nr:uncharacterized protein LOC127257125 isoform X2 [Andrographis paniculata]
MPKSNNATHIYIHISPARRPMGRGSQITGGGERKLRLLCLHGFRTSGEIIKKQVTGKWPDSVLQKLDLVFVDAPFPSQGKSDVEGIFDPPYYEWFQFNKEFTEYQNLDQCLAYIEDCMIKNGPFDGLLGFSQGVALTKVPKIKVLVIIGGAKFRAPSVVEKAYSSPIRCASVHFLGDQDFLKQYGTQLLESFVDPLVIRHPKGHTIPRFDEKGLESMLGFIQRVQADILAQEKEQEKEKEEEQQQMFLAAAD